MATAGTQVVNGLESRTRWSALYKHASLSSSRSYPLGSTWTGAEPEELVGAEEEAIAVARRFGGH
jgi:hypothetical protein